jgi:hypothetical protein
MTPPTLYATSALQNSSSAQAESKKTCGGYLATTNKAALLATGQTEKMLMYKMRAWNISPFLLCATVAYD